MTVDLRPLPERDRLAFLAANIQGLEKGTLWSTSSQKRAFDFACAFILVVASMPLVAVLAAIVKLTSAGPALFLQTRTGQHGREFVLFKLRTMHHANGANGILLTSEGDRRVTRFGGWLRKWKLDELPQFLNVLKGDMSLVGPRPDMKRYIDTLSKDDREILNFRPGITSRATLIYRNEEKVLASVPGANTEQFYLERLLPEKVRTDLGYAQSATFISDCGILLRTVLAISHA